MNYDKTIFTALFTLLAAACTHDGFDSGDSRRTEMHDTEIEFVLGTTQTGTRSTVYGHTFVPDGALIPQNEPPRIVLAATTGSRSTTYGFTSSRGTAQAISHTTSR